MVLGLLVTGALPRHSSDDTASGTTPSIAAPVTPSQTAPSLAPSNDAPQSDPQASQGADGQGQNGLNPAAPGNGQSNGQSGSQPSQGTAQRNPAAAAVTPGLVDIVSTIGFDGREGAGTGIILSSDGLVLTNHHVVAGSTSLTVTAVATGKSYKATVLGYDPSHDIAVIKLANASGLTVAPLGDSSKVAIGDEVVGVGNAGGRGGQPSVATGKVTALGQSITAQDAADGTSERLSGLIQTDAPIEAGDSGGALVNSDGKVIGVITAGAVSGQGQTVATQGYAVPLATAKSIADQIIAGQASSTVHIGGTAFLGVSIGSNAFGGVAGVDGVPVTGVTPGTAAAKAGIEPGSVITGIGGQNVHSAEALHSALAKLKPGDRVSISWTDFSGSSHTAKVTLGEGPVG
jgi:S1-C subfamily serine protease